MRSSRRFSILLLSLPLAGCASNQQAAQCYPVSSWSAPAFRCAGPAMAPDMASPVADLAAEPAKVEISSDTIDLKERVQFESNSAVLLDRSRSLLDDVARTIIEHPELRRIRIEGHTDHTADTAYNQKLSTRRAEVVRAYLIDKGVEAGRLEAKGLGESKPIADNATSEGQEQNRRVELHIVERAP
jgi:outer membrane protein OmpA-like peptidoglycan-associated protein